MNKQDKQRLINAVLEKNPNCTECGKLIKNYQFEYEPKFMPLDAPVVSRRADNGHRWVMCKECSNNQSTLRNEIIKSEAKSLIENNVIKKTSVKEMSIPEIRKKLHKENLAMNILLEQYGVPKDVIREVKCCMRNEFHVRYFIKHGKFTTEIDG